MFIFYDKNTLLVERMITNELVNESDLDKGFYIDENEIPPYPPNKKGIDHVRVVTPSLNGIEYREQSRPLTDQEKIVDLQEQNAQIMLALVMNDLI